MKRSEPPSFTARSPIGGAAAWPLTARVQHERMYRVAMIIGGSDENDPDAQANGLAFVHATQQLGWGPGPEPADRLFLGPRTARSGSTARGKLSRAKEIADGIVVNSQTKQRFTYSDPCVERGVTVAYQEEAHKASIQAVKEILSANLKLN